jgi:hypothetical protein
MVLPIKYLRELPAPIALLHGRTSYIWNGEEARRGRKLRCNCVDREMRSRAHLMSTINYLPNNPVKHKLVERWRDWSWSSAEKYPPAMGREQATAIWNQYTARDAEFEWDDFQRGTRRSRSMRSVNSARQM